jgi:hypothetical protein
MTEQICNVYIFRASAFTFFSAKISPKSYDFEEKTKHKGADGLNVTHKSRPDHNNQE